MLMSRIHNFLFARRRTTYALLIAIIAGVVVGWLGLATLVQQAAVLAWKLLLVSTAVFVAHLLRKQLFPYIDLKEILDESTDTKDGLIFLGMILLYCAIILALTQGL